ncbi:MAG: DivIVA domain-containing protein [Oscillospiraceae bacterium]
MFSAKEIRQITFEKVVRGYRPEDVESFMEKIADEFETLSKEKQDIEEQLYVLAEKIEQYKGEEESIKSTLISAQKLGESIINEAQQKAEAVLKEANIRKNDILADAHEELEAHEENLVRIKKEVSDFKIKVLSMYREHIESLSALPEVKKEPSNVVTPEAQPVETIANEAQIPAFEETPIPAPVEEDTKVEVKKLIDDYVISPESHQGFNNISSLFDK